jgi:ketosteroid isomerase-like protein
MSQENVEFARRAIHAFNRRDLEGFFQAMDPEIRFEHRLAELQGSFVGSDAVRAWFADLVSIFDTWHIDCTDVRDLGDRVVVLGTVHTTGKGSGVETELPLAVVAEFRGGLVIDYTDYGDWAQALEAAGLQE